MANYPLPAFHFQVKWSDAEIAFSEVSGLTIEHQVLEYRDGMMREYGPIKQPGLPKFSNITFKRGIIKGDNGFYDWLNTTKLNKVQRRDLVIMLLDEEHNPVVTWTAKNAFPVKVEGPSLKASANEIAIESIEVAHEGLTVAHG